MSTAPSNAFEAGRSARLLFLGDIGTPRPVRIPTGTESPWHRADLVCANLEGAIIGQGELGGLGRRGPVALHNDPAVLDMLRSLRVGAVGLANNHVYDFDRPIDRTRDLLSASGIASCGAGLPATAAEPAVLEAGGREVRILAFGWSVIGCPPTRPGREGVNPLEPRHVLETARRQRREHPDALLVFLMHWAYELELYPQPAHRRLAHDLAAEGVDAVVGCHAHVAQGVELKDGNVIAYGLGNWIFPHREADGFDIAYPPVARRQLALELALDADGAGVADVALHWYGYDPDTDELEREAVEAMDGPIVSGLTPYAGMDHAAYVGWFREHRTRRRGLPVYADYRDGFGNALRDGYMHARQAAGRVAARLGLKQEQRRSGAVRVAGAG